MDGATGDMAAAVEAAFSAATPAATTESPQTEPASAITTPAVDSPTAATQPTPEAEPGPVPYARFKEVNESANLTKKELEQLAWAKGIKPEHAPELARFYQRVTSGDPLQAYLDELGQLVAARPDMAGPLKSWAARTLGTRAQQDPIADPDPEPQPDIQLEDGRAVYSAQQLQKREAWLERRWESKVDAKLQPLKEFSSKQQADAITARIDAESKAYGIQTVTEMRAKPHFTELEGDIKQRMLADESLSLREAYAQSFIEKVIPQLAAGKAATLQQKVGASSANPSRPSGAVAAPPKDFREALEREFAAQSR